MRRLFPECRRRWGNISNGEAVWVTIDNRAAHSHHIPRSRNGSCNLRLILQDVRNVLLALSSSLGYRSRGLTLSVIWEVFEAPRRVTDTFGFFKRHATSREPMDPPSSRNLWQFRTFSICVFVSGLSNIEAENFQTVPARIRKDSILVLTSEDTLTKCRPNRNSVSVERAYSELTRSRIKMSYCGCSMTGPWRPRRVAMRSLWSAPEVASVCIDNTTVGQLESLQWSRYSSNNVFGWETLVVWEFAPESGYQVYSSINPQGLWSEADRWSVWSGDTWW